MIRITGGQFRGRQLQVPKGRDVRPTTSRVRESLFSILGSRLSDACMLDLFAGSGVVGFEALSRGAKRVVMVESSPVQMQFLQRNQATLKLSPSQCELHQADVFDWIKRHCERPQYDLIFLDPPYDKEGLSFVLRHALPALKPEGVMVWECRTGHAPIAVAGAHVVDTREYGETTLVFYEALDPAAEGDEA